MKPPRRAVHSGIAASSRCGRYRLGALLESGPCGIRVFRATGENPHDDDLELALLPDPLATASTRLAPLIAQLLRLRHPQLGTLVDAGWSQPHASLYLVARRVRTPRPPRTPAAPDLRDLLGSYGLDLTAASLGGLLGALGQATDTGRPQLVGALSPGRREILAARAVAAPLIGRDAETETLAALVEDLATMGSTTPVALVTAAPGGGRSRFSTDFETRLKCHALPVVRSGPEPAGASEGAHVRALLGDLRLAAPAGAPVPATLAADRLHPEQFVAAAVEQFLEMARRVHPVVIFDDADRLRGTTLGFLATLLAHLRFRFFDLGRSTYRAPFLLVLTAATGAPDLPNRLRGVPHRQLTLAPWDECLVEQYLASVLGPAPAPAPELIAQVLASSAGNPGLAVETTLGLLATDRAGRAASDGGIEPLDAAARAALAAIAVLGPLDRALLAAACGGAPGEVEEALAHLVVAGLAREDRFAVAPASDAMRTRVREGLAPDLVTELHRRASRHLAQLPLPAPPEVVAHHLAAGGERGAAIATLVRAAAWTIGRDEPDRARDLSSHGLALLAERPEGGADRLALLCTRARADLALGDLVEAARGFATAHAELRRSSPKHLRLEILLGLAASELKHARLASAARHLRTAMALGRRLGGNELVRCLRQMGMLHVARWQARRARTWFEQAVAVARAGGDPTVIEDALSDFALHLHAAGRPDLAVAALEEVAARFPPRPAPTRRYGKLVYRLGGAQYFAGRYGEARANLERALWAFTHLGDRDQLSLALNLLGLSALALGLLGEAVSELERALALAQEIGAPRTLFFSLGHLGIVRGYTSPDRGRDLLREALRMAPAADTARYCAPFLLAVGRLSLRLGDTAEAERASRELERIARREPALASSPLTIHLRWIARGRGQPREALEHDRRRLLLDLGQAPSARDRLDILRALIDLDRLAGDSPAVRARATLALATWDELAAGLKEAWRAAYAQHPDRYELALAAGQTPSPPAAAASGRLSRQEADCLAGLFTSLESDEHLEPFLDRALASVVEATGATGGAILLRDGEDLQPVLRHGQILAADHENGRKRALALPLLAHGKSLGLVQLELGLPRTPRPSTRFLRAFAGAIAVAVDNLGRIAEAERLDDSHHPSRARREATGARGERFGLVGESEAMRRLDRLIEKAASARIDVLISGETGTGKELVARAIHESSARAAAPFVAVNCAALVESLFESELFGIEKGTATGVDPRIGRFELAHGGTLFLDEIAELSLSCQAKLLRAIQERRFRRLGGRSEITVDLRLIAASNRSLEEEVQAGRFRADLLFRLRVYPIPVPPLRERREDIAALVHHFVKRHSALSGVPALDFGRDVLGAFQRHSWPGNVRELENLVARLLLLASGAQVRYADLPAPYAERLHPLLEQAAAERLSEKELLRRYARHVLELEGGVKGRAIAILGIDWKTLQQRLK